MSAKATKVRWDLPDLYTPAFRKQIIRPLIFVILAYSLRAFIQTNDGDPFWLFWVCGIIVYLGLTYLLYRLLVALWRSEICYTNEHEQERTLNLLDTTAKRYKLFLWLNFGLGLIILLLMILNSINSIKEGIPEVVMKLPLVHLVILVAPIAIKLIQFVLNDFYDSIRKHLSYFYPSILSITILAFVVAKQEQFGAFFIELVEDPLNMLAFSILFAVSVITVWFAPSYLYFTDHFTYDQKDYQASYMKMIKKGGFVSLLVKIVQAIPKWYSSLVRVKMFRAYRFLFDLIWKHKADVGKSIEYRMEPNGFVFVRLFLGVCYIATLANLSGNVWLKSIGLKWVAFAGVITLLSILIPILASYFYFYFYRKNIEKWGEMEEDKKSLEAHPLNNFRQRLERAWNIYIGIFVLLLSLVLILTIVNLGVENDTLSFSTLAFFVLVTMFTTIPLMCFGYTFPRLAYYLKLHKIGSIDRLKLYFRNFLTVILGVNASVAFVGILFIVLLIFIPYDWIYSSIIEINAINIYLLLVNGVIAFITIVDRYFRIRYMISKKEAKEEASHYTNKKSIANPSARIWAWAIVVIAVLFFINQQGNNYHAVPYIPEAKVDNDVQSKVTDIQDYTKNFMERLHQGNDSTSTEPIILVAADGGGLKAAYWTLLVLWDLDKRGLFDKNVFLMSGASGGSLGAGLYSYLKACDLDLDVIKKIIDAWGDSNFIAGDLTGVLTRWPYAYVLNMGNWPMSTQDRMESMAQEYIRILHQVAEENNVFLSDDWKYDNIRKKPYHYLWSQNDYELPLFFTNTARAEDGVKAWIHPFKEDKKFTKGLVELSNYEYKERKDGKEVESNSFISFPDALFLTNRFPIMSPAAKIKGKGHFIDVGAVDNSGVETLMQVMLKMKAQDSSSHGFFNEDKNPIIVLSVRHARSRFTDDMFVQKVSPYLGTTDQRSEISSFLGAVVSAGIYGHPKILDEIVGEGEAKDLIPIRKLVKLNLPFRLDADAVESYFFRQIEESEMDSVKVKVKAINDEISTTFDSKWIVEPPLGRLLARPSRDYMNQMLEHPLVKEKLDSIKLY